MDPSACILHSSFLPQDTFLNFLFSMPEWNIYLQQGPGLDWDRELLPPCNTQTGQVIAAVIRIEHLHNIHSKYDINEYIRLVFK